MGTAMRHQRRMALEDNRVVLFVRRPFQLPVLEPVYAQLRDEVTCLLTDDFQAGVDFRPRVILVADAESFDPFRSLLPGTILVWLRHGFSSKNYLARSVTGCDFACVTSEWTITDLREHEILPHLGFWLTGFVPMDLVLQGRATLPERVQSRLLPGPTLLYAPTYDRALTSAELLGDEWIASLRRAIPLLNVVIKPHPAVPDTHPEWMTMWRRMSAHEGVVLIDEIHESIYPLFPAADVLLTDASSVMFYYLAMDRPIVLVTNPRRFGDRNFDPSGPEWTWRDMGTEIDHPNQLADAVRSALASPGDRAVPRALYRERVFGSLTDGRAAARVAAEVRALLDPVEEDRRWVDVAWHSTAAIAALRRETADLRAELRNTFDRRARRALGFLSRIVTRGRPRQGRGGDSRHER